MITASVLFSMLADETRLRCLLLLEQETELCVCELEDLLESSQPKISRHLALLRKSGLVLDERRGKWIYYRLDPNLPNWVREILRAALCSPDHLSDPKQVSTFRQLHPCS